MTPTPPTKRTRKPRIAITLGIPRAPRRIDPGIKEIHDFAKAKVAQYRSAQASAKILATILNKRLAQLTDDDKGRLRAALDQVVTPPLPMS